MGSTKKVFIAPKVVGTFSDEAITSRVQKLIEAKDYWKEHINEAHVNIHNGNAKTGAHCYTVSLAPILDCTNCANCCNDCYDIRNVLRLTTVVNDRAKNSAIHELDIERYWKEINLQIKAKYIEELRINVGGDLTYEDFGYIQAICQDNPMTHVLFFTKNYDDFNRWLDEGNVIPENMHVIYSCWKGVEMKNPYNLPESHVLWKDGTTTAPKYGARYCTGDCSECYFNCKSNKIEEAGCWTLRKGEHVVFSAH